MSSLLMIILVLACIAASLLILISEDWHWAMAGLGIQYLVAFLLVSQVWPIGLATIKLVAGWLACILLSMTAAPEIFEKDFYMTQSARYFRLFSAFFILVVMLAVTPVANVWLPIPYYHLLIGLLMTGMGILQLGFSQSHFRIFLGLLTLLTGFEVIYASLEGSALLAALLAGITLALGLIGSAIFRRDQQQGES